MAAVLATGFKNQVNPILIFIAKKT